MSNFVSGIEQYIAGAPATFKLKDAIAALTHDIKFARGEKQRAEGDITSILVDDPLVFCNLDTGDCALRQEFFRSSQFLITPSAWEIGEGILLPGHRFAPFCYTEIFPSEITLFDDHAALITRDVTMRIEEAADYCSLLGAESMYDFLVAEHQQNAARLRNGARNGEAPVILSAFDCSAYYRKNAIKPGDAVLVTIEDWHAGVFKFSGVIPAEQRKSDAVLDWMRQLDEALAVVIEKYDFYLQIPEQFARALFLDGHSVLKQPQLSLDEYAQRSDRVEIGYMSGDTALVLKDELPEENYEAELPDEVMVSQGQINSLEEILKQAGCLLKMPEIEAFMLDQFHRQITDFETFYQRCLGTERLNFADEAQEAYFMNYLEDWWENRQSTYDRFGDEIKAPIRAHVLELVQDRRDWLRSVYDLEIDFEKLRSDAAFDRFAGVAVHLISFCRLLNSEQNFVSTSEADTVSERIEEMAEIQADCIEKLNVAIAKLSE